MVSTITYYYHSNTVAWQRTLLCYYCIILPLRFITNHCNFKHDSFTNTLRFWTREVGSAVNISCDRIVISVSRICLRKSSMIWNIKTVSYLLFEIKFSCSVEVLISSKLLVVYSIVKIDFPDCKIRQKCRKV